MMDVEDDVPPTLVYIQQTVPSANVDNAASDLQELKLAKVPITIITGKFLFTVYSHSLLSLINY